MYTNFILKMILSKGQESSGSAERLHTKIGAHMLLLLFLLFVSSHLPFGFYQIFELLVQELNAFRVRKMIVLNKHVVRALNAFNSYFSSKSSMRKNYGAVHSSNAQDTSFLGMWAVIHNH